MLGHDVLLALSDVMHSKMARLTNFVASMFSLQVFGTTLPPAPRTEQQFSIRPPQLEVLWIVSRNYQALQRRRCAFEFLASGCREDHRSTMQSLGRQRVALPFASAAQGARLPERSG